MGQSENRQQIDAPEYTGLLDKLGGALVRARDTMSGQSPEQIEKNNAFLTMMKDLRYPVGPPDENGESDVMNADFFAPFIAYHLVRCGWRPNSDKREIKPRKVPQHGVVADAVEWVGMDEPDDPLKNLDTMSLREVALLPERWKHEAIRRLGGHMKSDLPQEKSGWHVETNINVSNVPRDPTELFK